jgi:type IV pilus assembly protein PilA
MGCRVQNANGFTLAELLIVVVLIVLVAAIALPNLLRSQIAANEASAIAAEAVINKAEVEYQTAYPNIGFASSLAELGPDVADGRCKSPNSTRACLIEGTLANASSPTHARSGYWFAVVPTFKDPNGVVSGYVAGAAAAAFNQSGVRDFCSLEDGAVRFRVPSASSAPMNSASECAAMSVLQ